MFLKNKLKITLILVIIATFFYSNFSMAENETDEYGIMPISEQEEQLIPGENTRTIDSETDDNSDVDANGNGNDNNDDNHQHTTQTENMVESDVYLFEKNANIDYIIDGNAYIFSDNVTISSEIGGDVFIIAKNVNIDSNAYIYNNLFVLCDNLYIDGTIYDVYALSNNITLDKNGYVYRDIRATSSKVTIGGAIGRDAYFNCDDIVFDADGDNPNAGTIYGDLNYYSTNELSNLAEHVYGNTDYQARVSVEATSIDIYSYIKSLLTYLIFVLVIVLLLKWKTPKFNEKSKYVLTKKIGSVIGVGVLVLFTTPILVITLLLIPFTTSVSILLLTLYCILLAIASSIVAVSLGNIIKKKMNLNQKFMDILIPMVIALIIWILKLIPYISGFTTFATLVIGIGILSALFIYSNKINTTTE